MQQQFLPLFSWQGFSPLVCVCFCMTSLVVVCKPCMFTEPAPSHNNQSESSTKKLRSNTEPHLSASQNEINILEMDDDVIAGSPPLVPPPTASRPRPVPPKSLGPGIRGPPLQAPGTPHTSDRYMIYTHLYDCACHLSLHVLNPMI